MPAAGSFHLESEHISICMPSPRTILHITCAGIAPLITLEQINFKFNFSPQITQVTFPQYLANEAWWLKLPLSSEMKQQVY